MSSPGREGGVLEVPYWLEIESIDSLYKGRATHKMNAKTNWFTSGVECVDNSLHSTQILSAWNPSKSSSIPVKGAPIALETDYERIHEPRPTVRLRITIIISLWTNLSI